MSPPRVSVIDYGAGNLLSVCRALEQCGAEVRLIDTANEIPGAERLIFPGVGAFGNAMQKLNENGMATAVQDFAQTERPFLGICLGMQMMLDSSDEFGSHRGLGLIPGKVHMIPKQGSDGSSLKIPHIGWAALYPTDESQQGDCPLLDNVKTGEYTYFVHSYCAQLENDSHLVSQCYYSGVSISAVIHRDALFGCQFHPEKSGPVGLAILKNFLKI